MLNFTKSEEYQFLKQKAYIFKNYMNHYVT